MARHRLGKTDRKEMLIALRNGYALPAFNPRTGVMWNRQWKSWCKLQSLGLAIIEGNGEAEDLVLTKEGEIIARALAEGE